MTGRICTTPCTLEVRDNESRFPISQIKRRTKPNDQPVPIDRE
jgi:hypothetical protein